MNEVYIEPNVSRSPAFLYRRISWGAIFAGLLVTVVVQLTLTLLGASIGAATINPLQEQNPAQGLGIGSVIWILVTGLVSMFAGASVAGRMCGGPRRVDGMLHGLVMWSAATVAMLFLTVTATGALLGGLGSLVGGAMSKSGQGSGGGPMTQLQEKVREAFPQAGELLPTGREQGAQTPGSLTALAKEDAQLAAALAKMEAKGGPSASPSDREEVVNILSTKHGMDQQQAAGMITQWDQQIQQAKTQTEQKARQVGDVAASQISKGALWGFIALVLGGAIAAWGGWAGTASLRRIEPIATTAAT
jgi:hypothetical protein